MYVRTLVLIAQAVFLMQHGHTVTGETLPWFGYCWYG